MPATGTNPRHNEKKSIRLTADGFSFYPGQEVILVAGRSTWMPLAEFNPACVQTIYNKVYAPADKPSVVRYNILPTLEVIEIWSVDKEVERQLTADHPNHRWLGVDGVVLERISNYERQRGSSPQSSSLIASSRRPSGRRLYAYSHDGELFVFSFADGSLYYANSFWPATDEEARYYLFGVWQRLNFDPEKDELLLISYDAMLPLLQPYIRHIAILTPSMLRLHDTEGLPFDLLCV